MAYHYLRLAWSSAFLLPWLLLYALFPQHRVPMWRSSLVMAPFSLTEPLFVPEYWNPPSLFELAQRTGFDIESFIFSFAIGSQAFSPFGCNDSYLRLPPNSSTRVHHGTKMPGSAR